jgi:hypothetical protein
MIGRLNVPIASHGIKPSTDVVADSLLPLATTSASRGTSWKSASDWKPTATCRPNSDPRRILLK